jgi:hypothetical protein
MALQASHFPLIKLKKGPGPGGTSFAISKGVE